MRVIVCSAIRSEKGSVVCGPRHYDRTMLNQMNLQVNPEDFWHKSGDDQGFVDQFGGYLTREEALVVARAAGQLEGRKKHNPKNQLCSEDLY